MRYPVGFRPTWGEAMDAANESASKTGLRYSVFRHYHELPDTDVWGFVPVDTPDRTLHMPVRV